MKIAIVGDSFGVPNWYGPPNKDYPDQMPPECHLEFLLRNKGHEVTNFSENGNSNLQTLNRLQSAVEKKQYFNKSRKLNDPDNKLITLQEPYTCDLVIWFHTELLRSFNEEGLLHIQDFEPYRFEDLLDKTSEIVYSKAEYVKSLLPAKWVVLGGQAPVHHTIYNYKIADHIIPCLKSFILDTQIEYYPFYSAAMNLKYLESKQCLNTTEEKIKIMDTINKVYALCTTHYDKFPDYCHPGTIPHKQLLEYLENTVLN